MRIISLIASSTEIVHALGLGQQMVGRSHECDQYFNRPGPRVVESLEILAECFHPTLFDFGHNGVSWEPLQGPARK